MSASPDLPLPLFSPYPALPPPVDLPLTTLPENACPYLPDRLSTLRAFRILRLPGTLYHKFMNAGFRRTGHIIYQPICRGCRACRPLRVITAEFTPNKSLRRCRRKNADLRIDISTPELTEEKFAIYQRYVLARHEKENTNKNADGPTAQGLEPNSQIQSSASETEAAALEDFLYRSPVDTLEFTYRDPAGRLLAVGICDVCPLSLSSVYFYFDPDYSSRGLGNFGALTELDFAARHNIPHWYLGYWVRGCAAMEYKANFHPHEFLHPDGCWRPGS